MHDHSNKSPTTTTFKDEQSVGSVNNHHHHNHNHHHTSSMPTPMTSSSLHHHQQQQPPKTIQQIHITLDATTASTSSSPTRKYSDAPSPSSSPILPLQHSSAVRSVRSNSWSSLNEYASFHFTLRHHFHYIIIIPLLHSLLHHSSF